MNERDELADLYADMLYRYHGVTTSSSKEAADELLTAGYRKPRTIETVEELHALAVGSVVLENGETACQKFSDDLWDGGDMFHEDNMDLPATVLWEPES